MLNPDKESKTTRTDQVTITNVNNTIDTTTASANDKPFYVIEIGGFKLTAADIADLSTLSLILYQIISYALKTILNSKLILTLAITFGSLIYWLFLSFLQFKSITKLNRNNNTES